MHDLSHINLYFGTWFKFTLLTHSKSLIQFIAIICTLHPFCKISGTQLQWWRVWWGGGSSCRRREEKPVKKFPLGDQQKPVKIALSSVRKSTVFLKCYPSDLDAKIYGNSPAMYCICNRQSMSFFTGMLKHIKHCSFSDNLVVTQTRVVWGVHNCILSLG